MLSPFDGLKPGKCIPLTEKKKVESERLHPGVVMKNGAT